jgi:hypothetical protein
VAKPVREHNDLEKLSNSLHKDRDRYDSKDCEDNLKDSLPKAILRLSHWLPLPLEEAAIITPVSEGLSPATTE